MNQLVTDAIVLSRTNYGEADRIIKLLTPDYGKISLIAHGVRKPKSKLAGGIELFSVSNLTYIRGRGELGTLVSSRLEKYYSDIVKSIDRVQLGYELIKMLDRATEDEPEGVYFDLLQAAFEALNDQTVETDIVRFWFQARLLALGGHTPNLESDTNGSRLSADEQYSFDFDSVSFNPTTSGKFVANHIKFLRLAFAGHIPQTLQQIGGASELTTRILPITQTMMASYIRS